MHKIFDFFIAHPGNNFHPKILKPGLILMLAVILIVIRVLLSPVQTEGSATDSQILMSLINRERSDRNLPILFLSQPLLAASAVKSQDMIDRDYFAHQNPDGDYVWGEIAAAGYGQYKILGENLAIDFATSEGMIQAWIDSPSHRENLLHPDFEHQGLTALYGDYQGRYTNLTTSLFGAQEASAQTPTAPPAPQKNPAPVEEAAPPAPAEQIANEELSEPESKKPAGKETGESELLDSEPAQEGDREQAASPSAEKPDASRGAGAENVSGGSGSSQTLPFNPVRILFIIFGVGFLAVLAVDSAIIFKKETRIRRGHPSYHFFIFFLLVLVSLLVWWWR